MGRGKSHNAKKLERGTRLHCNGFAFYFRGFGCVQSQVLSTFTYGKSAKCTKSCIYSVRSVVRQRKMPL